MLTDFQAEENFYSKKFHFSYSGLNKLLFSPRSFYNHYILNQREDKMEQHLVDGSLLHCLLLEEDKFDEKFVVSPGKLPGDSAKKVLDKVFTRALIDGYLELSLEDLKDDILAVLQEINLHQSLKTDAQRIEKMVTDENLSYYDFLRTKGDKLVIDNETLERVKLSVDEVKQNQKAWSLLGIGNPDSKSEVPLLANLDDHKFGLKGIVDNIRVAHDEKVIYITDLKTTGKLLQDFPETVEYYKYWLQAAVYVRLVRKSMPELSNYGIKFHFIVVDKLNQSYAFEVSSVTLREWLDRLDDVLKVADYHYTSRNYDLPYEYKEGSIIL
jgi:PD-(D/E)XK nuclease superfamily